MKGGGAMKNNSFLTSWTPLFTFDSNNSRGDLNMETSSLTSGVPRKRDHVARIALQTLKSMLTSPVAAFVLLASLPLVGRAQLPYELVRGPDNPLVREEQAPMCRELLKNLNELKYEPPMTCRRKFDPMYTYFPVPDWKPLDDKDALQAALALERSSAEADPSRPPREIDSRFEEYSARVRKIAAAGQLQAWEAKFGLVENGEETRVVLASYGKYEAEKQCYYDTKFGVLLPDRFEADKRYRNLFFAGGEPFLYKGTTYIAKWRNVPSATLFDRVGPRGTRHRGYLLVQSMFWLKGHPSGQEVAGAYDTVCQIGWERLRSSKKGGKQ
jgi:hypothetical protein